jgi:hypothetical protein
VNRLDRLGLDRDRLRLDQQRLGLPYDRLGLGGRPDRLARGRFVPAGDPPDKPQSYAGRGQALLDEEDGKANDRGSGVDESHDLLRYPRLRLENGANAAGLQERIHEKEFGSALKVGSTLPISWLCASAQSC